MSDCVSLRVRVHAWHEQGQYVRMFVLATLEATRLGHKIPQLCDRHSLLESSMNDRPTHSNRNHGNKVS